MIDDIALARALHVLFVTHWIGGVAFVTLVALPLALASEDSAQGWALFGRSSDVSRPRSASPSRSPARTAGH
ncbi:MAG: hypothetical protein ABSA66_11135 [Roseiarcus sp.]|jgi:putative copper export protein